MLAIVALVVRLPTFLSSRALSFDDGVYGASVVDMRRGLLPYRDLFSSQGPLHLPLLYAGDILGGHAIDAPRLTPLVAGIVTAIAIWASARRLGATRAAAGVAGLLVATTGTMLWATGQITGDGPAAALTALAVWAALVYRDEPRWWRAVLAGALFGSALATKPIVVAAVVPLAGWLLARRRGAHVVAAAGAVVGAWFASALPWGLTRVWQQSVEYHTSAGPSYPPLVQLEKLTMTLATRDALIVAVVVLGLVAAARLGPAAVAHPDVRLLQTWLALVALVVLVPWEVANQRDILWPSHMTGTDAEVVAQLRLLPPGAQAIADDPGLVWRAGLTTPAQMNDTTDMRVFQGGITTRAVADAAASARTCAVVITPGGFGIQLSGLRDAIAAEGYHLARAYGHDRELWLRPCSTSRASNSRASVIPG